MGWVVSGSLHTAGLPLLAFEHVLVVTGASRGCQGLVHHSDRDAQHVSLAHSDALITAGVSASVTAVALSYDNALAETVNGPTRLSSSAPSGAGSPLKQWRWPRWTGATGGTVPACTRPWPTALPRKSRQPTVTTKTQRPFRTDSGTKPKALHRRHLMPVRQDKSFRRPKVWETKSTYPEDST